MRAVILISGNGSNLQSIIDSSDKINLKICCVLSNKENAFGLIRAKNAQINFSFIDPLLFESKLTYDQELISIIDIEKARRKDKLDPNQFLNINIRAIKLIKTI